MKKFFSLFVAALFSIAMFADTWTVAGSSEEVFGTTWDPSNTANDMELVEGTQYQLVKTDYILPKCDIAFKVCKDHKWDEAYPSSDYILSIPSSGKYTITITFDENSKVVGATADKTEDIDVLPTICMHGDFQKPDWKDTENFTEASDKLTASLKLTLKADWYYFGMKIGGTWTSNGSVFTRDDNEKVVVAGSGNMNLQADVDGEYTFTWTYATNTLTIDFPAKSEEPPYLALIGNFNGWDGAEDPLVLDGEKKTASVTVHFDMNAAEGYEFKILSGSNALSINNGDDMYGFHDGHNSAQVTYVSEISNPLFIKIAMEGDYTFTWRLADSLLTITFPEYPAVDLEDGYYLIGQTGWIVNALTDDLKFEVNPTDENEWVLENADLKEGQRLKVVKVESNAISEWYGSGGEGYKDNYVVTSDIAGVKNVYFRKDKTEEWNGYIWIDKNDPTAVENTVVERKAVKTIENGQLVIIKNGVKYSVIGAELR
jgi:hypothetical protein